jgi:multiple antibiotic resistance protein
MSLAEYTLLAFSSLFVIVDPIAVIPAFLAMTPSETPPQRERMARLACLLMAGVLLVFALAGHVIFKVLGITLPAFQIAGSIVLLLVALDMLRAQGHASRKRAKRPKPARTRWTSQSRHWRFRCWRDPARFQRSSCSTIRPMA